MNASTLNQCTGQAPPCPPGATTDHVADGVIFLRRQQASLSRRLRDPSGVAPPDAATEAAIHAEWLALIAAVTQTHGPDVAAVVTRLYEYHGRVVGSLVRQSTLPLPAAAARELRRLLANRLAELTDDAAGALCPRR